MTESSQSDNDLIQVVSRTGSARGPVDSYEPPKLIELLLPPNARVIRVDWRRHFESRRRKTVDWTWTVWIEWRISAVAE